MRTQSLVTFLIAAVAAAGAQGAEEDAGGFVPLDYRITLDTVLKHDDGKSLWFHPRVAAIPGAGRDKLPAVVMTLQKHLHMDDYYSGLSYMRTDDLGKSWSGPDLPKELDWIEKPGNVRISVCDVTPGWHAPTGKLLAVGTKIIYRDGRQLLDRPRSHEAAYAVYDHKANTWTKWRMLELPDTEGTFSEVTPGCTQWIVEPDGTILLPIYFRPHGKGPYRCTVLRCSFDGRTLSCVEHGDVLSLNVERGLCEPSLRRFNGRCYLTIRNDLKGYVAVGDDGLRYEPIRPWTFDDGSDLGSYNTQQHWLAHSDGLFLVYTRRGAGNDHIMRHRAPLFIAQVDPARLCVVRSTERVLIPERGAQMGNFGAAAISETESWVTVSEGMWGEARKRGAEGATFVARVIWAKPNALALAGAARAVGAKETAKATGPANRGESAMSKPIFEVRELYAPGHFGNSYEVMGEQEMRELLEEVVFWGFNRYGDWFDMDDCRDPFAEKRFVQLAHAMWQRKKTNFRTAQSLGLACDFIITPNHVYSDQCLPHLLAERKQRIFGQLICPSKPEARAIILKNYENLFADLARSGVRLSAICPCPYDFGGCACKECDPWILTWAKLMRDIHEIALRHHPGVQMHMIGWWWSAEEHDLLARWADSEAPDWVKSIALHIPYGKTDVSDVTLPRGCQRRAFVHIGYADRAEPRDIYGHLGPVIAPERLTRTIADLSKHGVTGFMAYSEGQFDDVNKAILAGVTSGKFATAADVLRAYAGRYFGADEVSAARWAAWLKLWALPFEVDTESAAREMRDLCAGGDATWRRRQWELKLEMMSLHARISQGGDWTPERLALVDEFWKTQEEIYRGLWGLTALRHIFDRRYTPLAWYAGWAEHVSEHSSALGKEQ